MKGAEPLPPALVLGGSANALAVARGLAPRGVTVRMSLQRRRPEQHTRHCSEALPIDDDARAAEVWQAMLLGAERRLDGSVLIPCDDDAIEFLALHHEELAARYLVDDARPELQLALLDKRRTLELARGAGVPTPNTWDVASPDDVGRVLAEARFPVIVKPVHSHLFQRVFGKGGRKFFTSSDEASLRAGLERAVDADLEVMVVEKIPGPDSLLGSYYTYIDSEGRARFAYTKKIVRRFPKNEGLACYHVAEWDEDLAAMGRRFFEGIGFRGLGNVEFKRDLRDGTLRLIECNPRLTAAQELLRRGGMDAAWVVYTHAVGRGEVLPSTYRQGLTYWYPLRDVRAFLELRRAGELGTFAWLRGLARPQVFPVFRLDDPAPALRRLIGLLGLHGGRG